MRALVLLALLLLPASGSARALDLEGADGEPVTLELREGERALVVHFWATWCPECVEELPMLAAAATRCRASAVRLVAVNVAEPWERIRGFLDRHGLKLSTLRDPRGRAWRSLRAFGLPTNLTWTKAGRRVETGPRSENDWRKHLEDVGCPVHSEAERY